MKLLWLLAPACLLAAAELPDPAHDPLEKAYQFLRTGDYSQAIVQFAAAVNLAPERASIRKELGYAYLKAGEIDSARTMFEQALALDPGDDRIALQLAYSYQSSGSTDRTASSRMFTCSSR